jgi:hypothetical protein
MESCDEWLAKVAGAVTLGAGTKKGGPDEAALFLDRDDSLGVIILLPSQR